MSDIQAFDPRNDTLKFDFDYNPDETQRLFKIAEEFMKQMLYN